MLLNRCKVSAQDEQHARQVYYAADQIRHWCTDREASAFAAQYKRSSGVRKSTKDRELLELYFYLGRIPKSMFSQGNVVHVFHSMQ